MVRLLFVVFVSLIPPCAGQAAVEAWLPVEKQVAAVAAGPQVTVIHFWAPWCPNCNAELANNRWKNFLENNPDVKFIFVTVWNAEDGHAVLEANGLTQEPNFQFLLHPNPSRSSADKMKTFMDLPVSWIPTTWVFRDGKLRYAMNYGELHFPLLQQLIRDSNSKWEHEKEVSAKPEPKP
jgi:thiol-disulfide isomerase/thioredoxin